MCNCERVYNWRATSNVKTKTALGGSFGYSMHAKISARIIYRFESWNRTCCDACNHIPYCHSISLIVHWKHCNLLLPVELKYKVQPTTNLHQAKQQWTFISLQWIMLNYEMQWPKLNVFMHKAMKYIRYFNAQGSWNAVREMNCMPLVMVGRG
jgi:hypothetical protein